MNQNHKNLKTRQYCIVALCNLAEVLNHTPTTKESERAGISIRSIRKLFGTYNNALISAGLKIRRKRTRGTSDKSKMLYQYIEYSKTIGKPASYRDINAANELASGLAYSMQFGGMRGLKIAAGFPPHLKDRNQYTREEIAHALKVEVKKAGHLLSTKEVNENPNLPSLPTTLKYFETTHLQKVWAALGLTNTTTLKIAL